MKDTNTFLLESKLKRLRISLSQENGKIIISKAKINVLELFFLVFLPFFMGFAASIFYVTTNATFEAGTGGKFIGLIIFMFGVAVVNGMRIRSKFKSNKNRKILSDNIITIVENDKTQRFDATNVIDFENTIKTLDKEIYYGELFLIDSDRKKHLLLGFSGENESLLLDDLYWFTDYFKKHLALPDS